MKRRRILAIVMTVFMLLGMMPSALAYMDDQGNIIDPPNDQQHAHSYFWDVMREPTCTDSGYRIGVCSVCGQTIEDYPWPLGHNWGGWQTISQASCTSGGQRQRTCQRCGETETETTGALGHSYQSSTVIKEPTCSEPGQRQARCTRCGETIVETIATIPHIWGDEAETVAPGKWTAGVKSRKCTVCGTTVNEATYLPGTVLPGTRGEETKHLQELLNAAGYDCGTADGIAGNRTDAAIKAAEADAGAPQDGIGWVGLQEWLQGGEGYEGAAVANPVDNLVIWVEAPASIVEITGNIPTTIHLRNSGNTRLHIVDLVGLYAPLDGSTEPVDGESVDLGELASDNAILEPGQEVTAFYSVLPTENDIAAGQIMRTANASYLRVGANDGAAMSAESSFVITLGNRLTPVEPIDNFAIWAEAPVSAQGNLGEVISVPVHVRNTGNTELRLSGAAAGIRTEGSVEYPEGEIYDLYGLTENNGILEPAGEAHARYDIVVTEADLAAGQVRRTATVAYRRYENGDDVGESLPRYADIVITLNGDGGIVLPPNSVTGPTTLPMIPIPLDPVDDYTVWNDAPASVEAAVGDFVPVVIHVQNTGNTPLQRNGYAYYPCTTEGAYLDAAEGEYTAGSYMEKNTMPSLPVGAEDEFTYYVRVTEADMQLGEIRRIVSFNHRRYEGGQSIGNPIDRDTIFTIALGEGTSKGAKIEVTAKDADTPNLSVGESGTIYFTIENTGSETLSVSGYEMTDSFDNALYGIESISEEFGETDPEDFKPGDRYTVAWQITATDSEGSQGYLVRTLGVSAFSTDVPGTIVKDSDSLRLDVAESGAPALMLEGTPQEYTTFYPNDTFTVDLKATNIGEHDLRGLILEAYRIEFASGDETKLEDFYSAGATTILPVDGSDGSKYVYTIRPEDAGTVVTLLFKAKAADTVTTEIVKSEPWMCEFQVEGGDEKAASLYIEQIGPETIEELITTYCIHVPIRVTNTGDVKLDARYAGSQDGNGNDTHLDADSDSHIITSGSGEIGPGESFTEDYVIFVRPEDKSAGIIERTFWNIGYPIVSGTAMSALDDSTEVPSNVLDFEYDLREEPTDAQLTLTLNGPASQPDGALGEVIKVPYRSTNTGSVTLNDYSSRSYDENGVHVTEDGIFLVTGDASWMEPGDYVDMALYIKVRPEDVDAGVIRRKVQHIGFPVTSADDGASTWTDFSTKVPSNELEIEIPLRDVPPDGTGELTLTHGTPSQSIATVGQWLTVPLTLTNSGNMGINVNGQAAWNPDNDWQSPSPYVSAPTGGTGNPYPLEPSLYITYDLSIYVTPADEGNGVIQRQVYFYGTKDGASGDNEDDWVYSNTDTIEIPLRGTPLDNYYVNLELTADHVGPVYAEVGDTVEIPMTLTNHGNAAANGTGLEYWYEDGTYAHSDGIDFDPSDFAWIEANGGTCPQTYYAVVTTEDIAKGKIIRDVQEHAFRWLTNDPDSADDSMHTHDIPDSSNKERIEVDLLVEPGLDDPPTVLAGEPNLVLEMKQLTPPQTAYKSGQEIEYEWKLTNVGDVDCDFGGLEMFFTNKAGNMVSATSTFYGLDGREVLKAKGANCKQGTGKITLDASQILSDGTVVVDFYGRGFFPFTTEVWVTSNKVEFQYLIDEYIWTPEQDVQINKIEFSTRPVYPEGTGYALNDTVWYLWSVYLGPGTVLKNYVIEDSLYDDGFGGHIIDQGPSIGSEHVGMGFNNTYPYVVTKPDVDATFVTNTITISWDDEVNGGRLSKSSSVTVPTVDKAPVPPTRPGTLKVYKTETSTPGNGKGYYEENETIKYDIVVYNDSNETMYDVYVDDPLVIGINKTIGYVAKLEPHASQTFPFAYIVTDHDCDVGKVINYATGAYTDSNGHGHTVTSNDVESLTGWPEPVLIVTKSVISTPADGKTYYGLNEVVDYKIVVTNNTNRVLTDIEVYEPLASWDGKIIGTAEHLHPTEARVFYFSYTITQEDVDRGYVVNYAVGHYTDGDTHGFENSNEVIVDTNGDDEDVNRTGEGFRKITADDCCVRTLTGKGAGAADYTLHICADHLSTAQQVDAMINAATDKDARVIAWKAACALWQVEVDAMYEALYNAALDLPTRLVVLNEKTMFGAQVSVYEKELAQLFPDDEEIVAQKIAELLMNKSADMCYELHTAPEARVDSYLAEHTALADAANADLCARTILEHKDPDTRYIETLCREHIPVDRTVLEELSAALTMEPDQQTDAIAQVWSKAQKLWQAQLDAGVSDRYSAATPDDRKVIAADRTTFGAWLKAREELLKLLYPDDEATVNEVMAKTIMNRVIDDCIADGAAAAGQTTR